MSQPGEIDTLYIELIRARPCLYNTLDPNYKDTSIVKRNNWRDVTEQWFNISGVRLDESKFYFIIQLLLSEYDNQALISNNS